MSFVSAGDGVRLHVASTGEGAPIVFIHEFGGTGHSFDLQIAALKDAYRCVAFNARGYPPSEVPSQVEAYSQDLAAADVVAVLDGLKIDRAHLVGVSMGAAAALQVAIRHPDRVRSVVLASIGTGSDAKPEELQAQMEGMAKLIETQGLANLALSMGNQPARRKLREKAPQEFDKFIAELKALSTVGMANTMRGVQKRRAPIYAHEAAIKVLQVPVMVVLGGDDAGCQKPSEFLARTISGARLEIFPGTGHLVNIEEAERFNALLRDFVAWVESRG